GSLSPPDRLVNEETFAIETPQALDLAVGQVGEQGLVEAARALTAPRWPAGPTDDVVLHIARKRRQHTGHIIFGFEGEVLVDLHVHFFAGHAHDRLHLDRIVGTHIL